MAKADKQRAVNETNSARQLTSNSLYDANNMFSRNYDQGSQANLGSYDQIMGMYNNFYNNPGGGEGGIGGGGGGGGVDYSGYQSLADNKGFGYTMSPEYAAAISRALGGYGNFAETGGFSDQDKQDIRARAIAPTRAIYANAQDNLNRSRSLSGGGSNYAATSAKMAREQAYGISDMNVNANASLAQMVQQGKLAGLGGLSSTGIGAQGAQSRIDELNAQGWLSGLSGVASGSGANSAAGNASNEANMAARLAALQGMTGLYGSTPGMSQTFGNQYLQSGQNLLMNQQMRDQFTMGNKGKGIDWGKIAGTAGTVAIAAMSDRNMKEDIKSFDEKKVLNKLSTLPISRWKYKGNDTTHIGPMAQDFKKHFGVGDGKTISLVDVMGITMAANKGIAKIAKRL